MISIRKAASDIDRMEELLGTLSNGYEQAVRAAGQYAIELKSSDVKVFRTHLDTLREKLNVAEDMEQWKAIEASFRGELRDYRDKAVAHVIRMRNETKAAAAAMQLFADSITSTGVDHEDQLRLAVQQLMSLSESESLSQVRLGLRAAAGAITDSVDMLRRSHQMAVAQLRDELRLLHKQLEVEKHSAHLDVSTGVWNRQKLDAYMAELFEKDRAFCVMLIHVRQLKHLAHRYSPGLIEGGLKAMLQRFAAMLGDRGTLGRWNEEHFLTVMITDPATAMAFSRETTNKLSSNYSVQENGLSKSIPLQAVTGIVERPNDCSSLVFQQRLLQMSQLLIGG